MLVCFFPSFLCFFFCYCYYYYKFELKKNKKTTRTPTTLFTIKKKKETSEVLFLTQINEEQLVLSGCFCCACVFFAALFARVCAHGCLALCLVQGTLLSTYSRNLISQTPLGTSLKVWAASSFKLGEG